MRLWHFYFLISNAWQLYDFNSLKVKCGGLQMGRHRLACSCRDVAILYFDIIMGIGWWKWTYTAFNGPLCLKKAIMELGPFQSSGRSGLSLFNVGFLNCS